MAGFGLINMNGRLYDPYLQRFLSPDIFVQFPNNGQSYNRYSYCLNNPMAATDPSGWMLAPSNMGREIDSYFSWSTHSGASFNIVSNSLTSDYSNSWYNTYQRLRRKGLNLDIEDYYAQLYSNKFNGTIKWYTEEFFSYKDNITSGENTSNVALGYVGKLRIYHYTQVTQSCEGAPEWMGDVNSGVGAFGLANGAKTELIDYAIRSNYKSARTWGDFNKLRSTQQAWRTTNTLGKTGASYLNGAKLLSKGVFGVTVINSGLNAGSAFYNDDPNKWGVAGKAALDVTMGYIGFLGPIGFGISATYFILDASGAFNSWSQPTNR